MVKELANGIVIANTQTSNAHSNLMLHWECCVIRYSMSQLDCSNFICPTPSKGGGGRGYSGSSEDQNNHQQNGRHCQQHSSQNHRNQQSLSITTFINKTSQQQSQPPDHHQHQHHHRTINAKRNYVYTPEQLHESNNVVRIELSPLGTINVSNGH